MARVALRNITKQFGLLQIFQGLHLDVADRELLCLLGPSGSGKTTLLQIIAGLERLDDGEIWVGDREISTLPPRRRHLGMMFQGCALYRDLSVRENLAYLPFILPKLMEGHNVLWGDIAAIATIGAMPVIVLAFSPEISRARTFVRHAPRMTDNIDGSKQDASYA